MKKVFVHVLVVILILSFIFQPSSASALSSSKVTEPGPQVLGEPLVQLDPLGPETPEPPLRLEPALPDWRMDLDNRYEPLLLDPNLPDDRGNSPSGNSNLSRREYIPPTAEQLAQTKIQADIFDCTTVTDVPWTECEALVALYVSTNGAGWTTKADWLTAGYLALWYGVTVAEGHVTELDLASNQLTGSIPADLGNLINLSYLLLDSNQLTGSIPPELGSLTNLYVLGLSYNQLSGNIPPELGNLTNLSHLNLSYNQLSGSIPPELGNLTNLSHLFLDSNQLTGSIPPELGKLTILNYLNLSSNQLSGSIPPELGSLTNLYYLFLYSNQLTGSIPLSFSNLSNMFDFDFADTNLCEPADAAFQAWKLNVPHWFGTGVTCQSKCFLPLIVR